MSTLPHLTDASLTWEIISSVNCLLQCAEPVFLCLPAHACVPTSRFGTSEFDAVGVNAFYSFWTTFSTFKSFSWADLYNPASAPNRWILVFHVPV